MLEIFTYTLEMQRRVLRGWAFGLAIYLFGSAGIFFLMEYQPAVLQYMERLTGVPDLGIQPAVWFALSVFTAILPAALGIFAVELGSRLIAGEENLGWFNLLLGVPLPRWQLLFVKFCFLLASILALCLLTFVLLGFTGLVASWRLMFLLPACLVLAIQTLLAGSLAFSTGAVTGSLRAARLVGLTGLLALLALMLLPVWNPQANPENNLFLLACSALKNPLIFGSLPICTWVQMGLCAVLFGVAWIGFQRRDLSEGK